MDKKKLSLKKDKQEFIESAKTKTALDSRPQYPWEAPEVTDRVIKTFNLRLPETDYLKLKYIVTMTRENSMHEFCYDVVKQKIDKVITEITGE